MAERTFDGVKLSVAFSQAASLANIASGENISTSFGKISKFIGSIQDIVAKGSPIMLYEIDSTTESGIYYGTDHTFLLHVVNYESSVIQYFLTQNTFSIRLGTISNSTVTWGSSTLFATNSDITAAINGLNGGSIGTPSASKTIASITEQGGNVSATFQDISITKSQVSDFPQLGSAASKDVSESIADGDEDLLTSSAAYADVPSVSLRRGTIITTPANLNNYTTPGRYYTTKSSNTISIVNSPMAAMGMNTSTGVIVIDGVNVTFNANLELIVEELSTYTASGVTHNYLKQTVKYSYNSSSTSSGPTTGRNFARSRYFTRTLDFYGWSNWYMHSGTEIVPAS